MKCPAYSHDGKNSDKQLEPELFGIPTATRATHLAQDMGLPLEVVSTEAVHLQPVGPLLTPPVFLGTGKVQVARDLGVMPQCCLLHVM